MIFVGLENYLAKGLFSFNRVAMACVFLVCFILAVLLDGNYFSIILMFITGVICVLFSGKIRRLQEQNQLVMFQKDIMAGGFDASVFAFFIFSSSGRCVFINRIAQSLFPGLKIKNISDFIQCFGKYPKVVEAIHKLQISAQNMKQTHVDIPLRLNKENVSLWRIAVSPLAEQNEFFCWTIIDLTPSNAKVESIDTDSTFLLNVINKSSVGYFCLDEDDRIIFCNNTFSYWIGLKVEDLIGSELGKYVVRESSDGSAGGGFKKNKTDVGISTKLTLKSELGDGVDLVARQIIADGINGVKTYIVLKEAQRSGDLIQALGKTKLYFEHIFEDAPVGILVTNGAEEVHSSNARLRNFLEVEKIDHISFLDFIADDQREVVREKLYKLMTGVSKSLAPFEIQFSQQPQKALMVYATKIEESKRTRENDGLVLYFVDVTETKELQHRFFQSQKMQAMGQLAGGIAHDFNNLLTAMIGYCDLLLEKYMPSDQAFNDVMQIKQNANRASNLVKQLLAFSRQQTLQPKILNVTDMISYLCALLKRLLGARIDLKVIHGRDVGFIKTDQIQFEQVIINLAVNARDAMKDGGTLSIQTFPCVTREPKFLRGDTMPPGNYVLIEVADTGSGIPEKDINRIFDPFFSTKEKGHGTGLGLSTVYGIVNQTGGFISIESKVGEGTKFSLYFPVSLPSGDSVLDDDNEKINSSRMVDLTGTGTILLVEDEDAVRMFSSRALRDKGYRVIEAANGESALEFIQKEADHIDLIITDVVMPKMDGPTLMENIKKHNPGMKVIFISGYTEDNFRESLANDSKVHFLAKPFNLKELALRVKEVMELK
ncbi:MAG: response regulator [Holosporaceae bacterium]|jgi:two-component system cell cycle sensor histidine kinase/response regulator CckA|nr:response regulator [Holosporaceae bacterium]